MSYDSLLNDTCTIQTKSDDYTANADGTVAENWPDTYEDEPCRLVKRVASYREMEMGVNPASTHVLFLKSTATVARGNRVVIDSDTYLVEDVDDPHGMGHHKEAGLRMLEV